METNDALTASLPYTFLAAVPALALLYLLFRKRRENNSKTRNCPHCKVLIGMVEPECSNCHQKVFYA